MEATPSAATSEYPIDTVAKSERGLERTSQGQATVLRWPAGGGRATIRVGTNAAAGPRP